MTEDIKYKMSLVWTFVRRPSKEDVKWLELFVGIKEAETRLNKLREQRKSLKKEQNIFSASKRGNHSYGKKNKQIY